jgi:hypothetical protein
MQSGSVKHMVIDITKSESNNLRTVFQAKKNLANNLPLEITSGGVVCCVVLEKIRIVV